MLIVVLEDDIYQEIQLDEAIGELGVDTTNAQVLYPISKDEVSFLQYGSFSSNSTVIVHSGKYDILKELFKADFGYWTVILYVDRYSTVSSLITDSNKPVQFPVVKDWEDRYNFFKKRLSGYKYQKGVMDLIIKLLIRKPVDYYSLVSYLQTVDSSLPITLEDVQYLFVDADMYRFDELVFNLFFGLTPRKTEWMLDYFIHIRGYAPRWVYQQLLKFIKDLGYLYAYKKRGVIRHALNKKDLDKRLSAAGLESNDDFLGYRMQKDLIERLPMVSKQRVMDRCNSILKIDATTEDELYAILMEGSVWRGQK